MQIKKVKDIELFKTSGNPGLEIAFGGYRNIPGFGIKIVHNSDKLKYGKAKDMSDGKDCIGLYTNVTFFVFSMRKTQNYFPLISLTKVRKLVHCFEKLI